MKPFKTLSHILTLGTGQGIGLIASAVFHILAARSLGISAYGQFAFSLSFGGLLFTLSEMGLTQLIVRETSDQPDNKPDTFGSAILLRSSTALLATLLGVAILWLFPFSFEKREVTSIVLLGFIFFALNQSFRWYFHAFQKFHYEAITNVTISVVLLLFGLGVATKSPHLINGFAFAFVMAQCLGLFLAITFVVRHFPPPRFRPIQTEVKRILSLLSPFSWMVFCSSIYANCDMILLSLIRGDTQAGSYGVAVRLTMGFRLIPISIQQVFLPLFSKIKEDMSIFKKTFIRILLPCCLGAGLLGFLIILTAKPLILILFGNHYENAIFPLQILGGMIAIVLINLVLGTVLVTLHEEKTVAKIAVVGLGINLLMNLLLIGKWGAVGAAFSILISETLICILLTKRIRDKLWA